MTSKTLDVLRAWESQERNSGSTYDADTIEMVIDSISGLRELVIEMGHVIRELDDDSEHLEFWSQDGGYVLDGRFDK